MLLSQQYLYMFLDTVLNFCLFYFIYFTMVKQAVPLAVIFTVRRYALHGLSYRNSVRLSVRHTRGLCPHGSTYDHDFFTVW